ncbi:MAG: hypothetical protein RJA86_1214 [Pseudomonadota bacterium]|jgi:hypothetical protein
MQNQVVVSNAKTGFRSTLAQAVALGSAALATGANAAIDVSSLITVVGEGVVAAGVIGLAFLGFKGGIAVFKSLRSAT